MNRVPLPGCTPVPLAAWLKAVGVLRLVAEQADPEVRGCWRQGHFELCGALDGEGLRRFFLHDYRPTPVVAPWNGGSGFFPKDNQSGIAPISEGEAPRLASYRQAIEFGRSLLARLGLTAKPDNRQKAELLRHFRAGAPEPVLAWFNAAVLLSGDDPKYPPLLGTGGNDGRLDFTNNFMQRLVDLFDPATGAPTASAAGWLEEALFGVPEPARVQGAIGQFSPGDAGGPNASTGFEGGSLINPWDFVFMIEGAMAFAAAVSRRLETEEQGMSYPFTVRPVAAGAGATTPEEEPSARAELWLPLWSRPAAWPELRALLAEGRARLGRHIARDGLDFARAVAALGVDRGIEAFQRYAFLMRSGKAYLATPAGRIRVQRNPRADLIAQLEQGGFLERVRRMPASDHLPAALRQAARRFVQALFEQAVGGSAQRVQQTLAAYGALVGELAHGTAGRELPPRPPRLSADWVREADDGSPGFRLAAALAGLGQAGQAGAPLAVHLFPLQPERAGWRWVPKSPQVVWTTGGLEAGLAAVLQWRALQAQRDEAWPPRPFDAPGGVDATLVGHWLLGRLPVTDAAIEALLRGLSLCRPLPLPAAEPAPALPAGWWVLRAGLLEPARLAQAGLLAEANGRLPLELRPLQLLRAGRIGSAVSAAWQRLRASGADLPRCPQPPGLVLPVRGRRLLASLLIPLAPGDVLAGLGRLRALTESETAMEETS